MFQPFRDQILFVGAGSELVESDDEKTEEDKVPPDG